MRARRMQAEDLPRVASLCRQLGYPVEEPSLRARFAHLAGDAAQALFVAEDDEARVVGWLQVQPRWLLESEPFAEIVGLVVDEAARRGGVGRALVAEARSWAKAAGFATLRVRSNVVRAESHGFYLGLGFGRTKTQHVYAVRL